MVFEKQEERPNFWAFFYKVIKTCKQQLLLHRLRNVQIGKTQVKWQLVFLSNSVYLNTYYVVLVEIWVRVEE